MIYFDRISRKNLPQNHPILMFDEFWRATSSDGKSVCWDAFKPMEMIPVLPWMLVLDRLSEDQYIYRLCGTGCDGIFNRNLTGSTFGEHVDKNWAKHSLDEFAAVVSGGGPSYASGGLPIKNRDHIQIFRGLYGFTCGGDQIDKLVAIVAPENQSCRAR